MTDRPTTSVTRAGRPRMRSRSAHLPSCIPVAPKAVKPRMKSAQRMLTNKVEVKVQVKARKPLRNQIKQLR